MKKIIALLTVTLLMLSLLAGCGEKHELYNNVDLDKFLEKGSYIGVKVDTKSEEFDYYYDAEFNADLSDNQLYSEVKDGTVQNGDTVNLDYTGKIDGVAFDGGTAQGYDLVIGSGSFIDDFEEELIGTKVGETRDVTARFPESYPNSPDLAGKEAVFTCKINKITRPQTIEEAYKKMGFESVNAYKNELKDRAIKSYILNTVCSSFKVKDYPETDSDILVEAIFEQYVDMHKEMYNEDFEEYLISSGYTVEQYKEQIRSSILPTMMDTSMVMYYIYETEELELPEDAIEKQDVEQPVIAEIYAIQDVVLDYLYENAVIK